MVSNAKSQIIALMARKEKTKRPFGDEYLYRRLLLLCVAMVCHRCLVREGEEESSEGNPAHNVVSNGEGVSTFDLRITRRTTSLLLLPLPLPLLLYRLLTMTGASSS